jgi:hypothetical protein
VNNSKHGIQNGLDSLEEKINTQYSNDGTQGYEKIERPVFLV